MILYNWLLNKSIALTEILQVFAINGNMPDDIDQNVRALGKKRRRPCLAMTRYIVDRGTCLPTESS